MIEPLLFANRFPWWGSQAEHRKEGNAMRVVRAAAAAALLCAGLAACSSAGAAGGSGSGSGSSASGPVAASSRDVSFTVDGTKTYGTLQIPAHQSGQHLAAALLLAGSGPTDRYGDQPAANVTPQTLKLVAGVLAQQGIMTLRFDKYFTGQTGAGAFTSDPGTIDLNAFVRQADYAYDYLIAQPGVDRQRMLVVGHSEGGFYAMLVADTVSTHPAGLALLEPQDQRILSQLAQQLDEQLDAAVAKGQLTTSDAQQQAQGIDNAIAQFRAGQQVETDGLLPQIVQQLTPELLTPGNAKVARTDDEVSPVDAAAKVAAGTRVLITDGTADPNIPVSTMSSLASALTSAGTTGPELKVLTGVNHLLHMPGTQDNDPVLAPSVVAAITAWAQPFATTG
jgi:alpha-beta hydrolase superfamily lysophospholipase